LPLLPHRGRDIGRCRHAADRNLHDLSFADLDACRSAGTGAASFATGKPLRWTRVYRLPAYVFFNHSIHIAKGVGCNECHGQIEEMPLTREAQHMYMLFCLNCHENPGQRLRPREEVFNMKWQRTPDTPPPQALLAAYNIHPEILSDCSICHR